MKDILTYTSYRQYIADYYADKKAKSAFTWQDFADEAGFSSRVYLKYVSEGRFNLSEEATIRVAKAMHLPAPEVIVVRLGLDEGVVLIYNLPAPNNDHPDRANTTALIVGGLKVYCCKIFHFESSLYLFHILFILPAISLRSQ